MGFLKGLALFLLGFLLSLSLYVFCIGLTLNYTVLNPEFITSEIDKLDMSSLAGEISEQIIPEDSPGEFGTTLVNTVTKLEPSIKEQVSAAIYSVYDYLLGESQNLDLADTLRNTLLSTDFVVSVVDEFDMSSLAGELLSEQLPEEIPEAIAGYATSALDDTIVELKPWIKEQVNAAADPVLDYLVGESQSFSVVIPLEPVKQSLKDNLWQAVLESPPPELSGIPLTELEPFFDMFYQQFSEQMPSTFELNESVLGTEMPAQIAEGLTGAEEALKEGRQYVADFQLGYKALLGFILLLIIGIVLITRQVKDATRRIGTIFLTFGIPFYAGTLIVKHFLPIWLPMPAEIPSSLQTWMLQLTNDFLAPLEMFSLGLLIGGVVLIIVSIVYPKWRQSSSQTMVDDTGQ